MIETWVDSMIHPNKITRITTMSKYKLECVITRIVIYTNRVVIGVDNTIFIEYPFDCSKYGGATYYPKSMDMDYEDRWDMEKDMIKKNGFENLKDLNNFISFLNKHFPKGNQDYTTHDELCNLFKKYRCSKRTKITRRTPMYLKTKYNRTYVIQEIICGNRYDGDSWCVAIYFDDYCYVHWDFLRGFIPILLYSGANDYQTDVPLLAGSFYDIKNTVDLKRVQHFLDLQATTMFYIVDNLVEINGFIDRKQFVEFIIFCIKEYDSYKDSELVTVISFPKAMSDWKKSLRK